MTGLHDPQTPVGIDFGLFDEFEVWEDHSTNAHMMHHERCALVWEVAPKPPRTVSVFIVAALDHLKECQS